MLKEEIFQLSSELYEKTVFNRRFLHANPEVSFEEYNTSAFIASALTALNIPFEKKGDTGIVALLKGKDTASDHVVALRADMDALPIQEKNDVDYKSANPGVMHACGHDVHTSSLLATATILSKMRSKFDGTVKFIFQPGEEKLPGGASLLINQGVLENPKPKCILGQHVMPELPVGKVGFRSGNYMASNDEIYITVFGKGGHAATPNANIDSVAISCQLITALQQIVSRQSNPLVPSVLSFGRIIGDGSVNVIPDKVEIQGTFRTLDPRWRGIAHKRMKEMAVSIVTGMGAKCSFDIKKGYPVLLNEKKLTEKMRYCSEDFLGKDNVVDLDLWMAAEDFAFYSEQIPGCFYRLGVGNENKGIKSGLHTSTFDVDEDSLKTGPALMAYLTVKSLEN